jgi:hypothetical protein
MVAQKDCKCFGINWEKIKAFAFTLRELGFEAWKAEFYLKW